MMSGASLPILLPWWGCLIIGALGGAAIAMAERQRSRPVDIDRIPWTSWTFKYFLGLFAVAFALIQLLLIWKAG